ncbi:MAG: alkaline phosphatase family protein [Candidatus Thiodiazotropha endolucinida]|nr:alkaline phosphatase family protein [Candidatus Thiodiazotropha sp. (ex Codakia orbicularis)]MBV2124732.1 alkaline phosphatase family protein [Candidatus Thiodiazotropha taylori]
MPFPDYNGGSIVNLMASLQRAMGGDRHSYPPLDLLASLPLGSYRKILLWVVDGLGFNYLRAHPEAETLNAHLKGSITSVFPPTTATAVTTFLTGDAPQQHGLTGWHVYFRELGAVLAVLPGRPRYGGVTLGEAGIDTGILLGHTPFSDKIACDSVMLSPAYIADSDFNRAHLGRARLMRHRNLPELTSQIAELLREGDERYLYAYWSELDSIGHRSGIWSEETKRHLLEIDESFKYVLQQCDGTESLIIICADHGQVDTLAADRVSLDDHPELLEMLSLPLCGEPRAAYCYLRPGCEQTFDHYVESEFAGKAIAYPSAELLEENWFGKGAPHPRLSWRIGDRLLLMQGNYTIKDWMAQERHYELVGVHGGTSEDEMNVPLIVAEI